jgi:guanine deaminase
VIIAGKLLLTANGAARLTDGWLRLAGDRIAELQAGRSPHTIDLGGDECVILPGFVDTHLHLPQFDSIGADGLTLFDWLEGVIFPAERQWEDASFAAEMTERVVRQLFSFGTTSFCAYATVHHDATVAAMDVISRFSVRACVGQVLMDRNAPAYLCRSTDQLLREAAELCRRYPPNQPGSRLEFAVTPRFGIACSEELMRGAARIARANQAIVQTHLAETYAEKTSVEHLFGGQSYAEVYDDAGLLTRRTLLAHGIHLSENERERLRSAGSAIAHCPTANVFLASGVMPWVDWDEQGLRLSLGSDIGAGTERSMVRVGRAMIEAAKYRSMLPRGAMRPEAASDTPALNNPTVTAAEAWWQITTGNANVAGWRDAGRLEAGAAADLLVIQPDVHLRETPDPLSMLLYAWDDRWLRRTFVAGQQVYSRD